MIWIEIIYGFACIVLAAINARLIQKGIRIKHFWNGLLHLAVAGAAALMQWSLWPVLIILLNTRILFNYWLNVFRADVPWNYVPSKPKSIVDQVELKIFKRDFVLPMIIYLLIDIIIHVVYYK